MSASLRPPDIIEENPDFALPRSVRLHNLIRFQLRANDAVGLVHWVSAPSSGAPGELGPGHWVAWLDHSSSAEDALRQAGIAVPAKAVAVA